MRICVFCGSSTEVDEAYSRAARELGQLIGERGHSLVYGGGNIGLMGTLAAAVKGAGGSVTGVIPRKLAEYGLASEHIDELIVTATMAERKATMEGRSDAFIALPGGFGTLEELLQAITLKQLGYLRGPIVLLNVGGFYDGLLAYFAQLCAQRFVRGDCRALYQVTADPATALEYVEGYRGTELPLKWA